MRISPARNTYKLALPNKQQNIHFGNFDNDKTKGLIVEKGILDLNDDTGMHKVVFNYFDTTPFTTIKSTKAQDGSDVVYAMLNREETNKHPNKTFLTNYLIEHS